MLMGEFLTRLEHAELGVEVENGAQLIGPRGPTQLRNLVRDNNDGRPVRVPLPSLKDGDPLMPEMLAFLLRRLGIRPADVGVNAADLVPIEVRAKQH